MKTITLNERAMLRAIVDCDYHDGLDPVDNPVWSAEVCDGFGPSAGGIVASLIKKGLISQSGKHNRDATVTILLEGYTALLEDERELQLYQLLDDRGAPIGAWTMRELHEMNPDFGEMRAAYTSLRNGHATEVKLGGGASPETTMRKAPLGTRHDDPDGESVTDRRIEEGERRATGPVERECSACVSGPCRIVVNR